MHWHSDWQRGMEDQNTEQTGGHNYGQFIREEVAVTRTQAARFQSLTGWADVGCNHRSIKKNDFLQSVALREAVEILWIQLA